MHNLIKEICKQEDILFESYSKNYVLRLTKNEKIKYIFGAYWDLNSASADRIACDKCACYTLLKENGVPAIEHELLYNPLIRAGWSDSTWLQAIKYFNTHSGQVVIKPNQGSSGRDVYYCDSISALETATQTIFALCPDAAISPFKHIELEYRIFYLKGKCLFAYGKTPGEYTWKHNLSEGATAFEIKNKEHLKKLENLASQAAAAIGITFATIDIAELVTGELIIVEINSGVQARRLVTQLPQLHQIIKEIYLTAIKEMFEYD